MWKEGSRTYFFYYIYSSSSGCHNNEVKSFLMSHYIFNTTRASVKAIMNYKWLKVFRHFWPLTFLHNFITANRQKLSFSYPRPFDFSYHLIFLHNTGYFLCRMWFVINFQKKTPPKTSHMIEEWSEMRIPELKFRKKKERWSSVFKPEFSSQIIII